MAYVRVRPAIRLWQLWHDRLRGICGADADQCDEQALLGGPIQRDCIHLASRAVTLRLQGPGEWCASLMPVLARRTRCSLQYLTAQNSARFPLTWTASVCVVCVSTTGTGM